MKANGPRHPQLPARGSVWPWILTLGCLLLILIAVLLPRQKAGRSDRAEPARPPGPTAPGQADSGPSGSRPFARAGAGPAPTAQEIVAGKVSQFARIRLGTVQAMARHFKLEVPDEVKRFFAAVEAGRLDEADALFKSMSERRKGSDSPPGLRELWPAVLETYGITEQTRAWPAQKLLDYGNAVLDSLRPGMIYVGGTDEGRFIPTLLNETSEGEHHTILTQNALADRTYLDYLSFLYGDRLATLSEQDSQKAFNDYLADAAKRLQHDQQFPDEPKQIRAGEDVRMTDGRLQVSGQVAVMAINEVLLQALMQKNPDASFALQESYPLKSTYAEATPLGPIMELRAQDAQDTFTAERATQSLDYLRATAQELLTDPATPDMSDPRKAYSKLALAQANLFLERNYTGQAEEALQLANELSPANPEAVFSYTTLLSNQKRFAEARQLVEAAVRLTPGNQQFLNLLQALNRQH